MLDFYAAATSDPLLPTYIRTHAYRRLRGPSAPITYILTKKYTKDVLANSSENHLRNLSDIVSRMIFRADFEYKLRFLRKLLDFFLSGLGSLAV